MYCDVCGHCLILIPAKREYNVHLNHHKLLFTVVCVISVLCNYSIILNIVILMTWPIWIIRMRFEIDYIASVKLELSNPFQY